MTLSFTNPGEIDLTAATVLGVNAKEGESPIGFFGTGLKYAIAGVLREGGTITIWQGAKPWSFAAREQSVRGRVFQIVTLSEKGGAPRDLGFTTDLGKHWKPWQVFRELMSNCLDEGGRCVPSMVGPRPGDTTIVVEGWDALDRAWAGRSGVFLDSTPIAKVAGRLEVHAGASTSIFYRGVRVMELEHPSAFTYNLLGHVGLTEDRTLASEWTVRWEVMEGVKSLTSTKVLQEWLLAQGNAKDERLWELGLNWGNVDADSLLALTAKEMLEAGGNVRLPPRAVALVRTKFASASTEWSAPSPAQERMLEEGKRVLACIGIRAIREPIRVAETLGADTLGLAKGNTIVLSARAFSMGQRCVTGTLLEEHLHIAHGYQDESRGLQNWLLDKLVEAAEELKS